MARLLERMLPVTSFDEIPGPAESKAAWLQYRLDNGRTAASKLLTSPEANVKMAKSMLNGGTLNYSLSLAPASESGVNVCPASTPECRAHCVAHAGNGGYSSVQEGRKLKTLFLRDHPLHFLGLLDHEISRAEARHPGGIGVRLNTFSDLPWHVIAPWLFTRHPEVKFYDYTKVWDRADVVPANWHLTLSATERTQPAEILAATGRGSNVAVVFHVGRTKPLPPVYMARAEVVDGDKSDARYNDGVGVVVGLRAKGTMRRGSSFALAV